MDSASVHLRVNVQEIWCIKNVAYILASFQKHQFCNVQSNLNSFQCSHKGMFILLICKSLLLNNI